MVAEKIKQAIIDKFNEIMAKFQEIFSRFENQIRSIVTDKKGALQNMYNDIKTKINNTIPGGIS